VANPPATWTTGHKKVLIIPVRFTDYSGPSDVPNFTGTTSGWGRIANGSMTAEMSAFMARQSYGRCTLEFTVLPEIDMGVSYTAYNAPLNSDSSSSKFTRFGEPGSFLDDARARARQVGINAGTPALYETDNYDLDIICTGFIPGQGEYGVSVTNGKGIYANLFTVLPHEIGHNLGLSHAWGLSRSTFHAPLTPRGSYWEFKYGNLFDLMGSKEHIPGSPPPDRDVGAFWKFALGWLGEESIATASSSGTYRIYPIDSGSTEAGKQYAMRIVRDPLHTYWFEHRQSIVGQDAQWAANGLIVNFGAEHFLSTSGDTLMLDMTPGSRGHVTYPTYAVLCTMHDAPLALGRTYSDAEANLHVTPIKKGGTTPESIDVVVNHGPFPSNHAPTLAVAPASVAALAAGTAQVFTSTASDADGDTLAYYWEFDDPDVIAGVATGGSNADTRLATQGTHTWTRAGTYLVRCTVTDMRGGKTIKSSQVTVTGGAASLLTISGTISDENGVPLAGAIANNYNGLVTTPQSRPLVNYGASTFVASNETAADGKYRVQIPSTHVSGTTYRLTVLYQGFSFTSNFSGGSVYVAGSSISNINFTRVRANRTISGYLYVAGRFYDPATDGPLTISNGAQSVQVIKPIIQDPPLVSTPAWSLTVPDDTVVDITATAANPTYTVTGYASGPHRITSDYSGYAFNVDIPGKIPQTGFAGAGTTSTDSIGTMILPVTMTPPPGYTTWSNQSFFYWIDPSSTAEYGVDYLATGGEIFFYGGKIPTPRNIPIKILSTGKPGKRTLVIKIGIAASTSILGPFSTYTYTIDNQPAFHAWLDAAYPGVSDPAVIGDLADPDRNGVSNLLEYALGAPSANHSNATLPIGGTNSGYLALTFTRPTVATDVTYTLQISSDLTTWNNGSTYSSSGDLISNAFTTQVSRSTTNGMETISVRDTAPTSALARKFIRLKVTSP